MRSRKARSSVALRWLMLGMAGDARAFDEAKYPDLSGQWHRIGPGRWDGATNQTAPLTPEYRAIYEAIRQDRRPAGWPTTPP